MIEAMSFGLPCVVSDVRGNRDLIQNGNGGYVIPAKDYIGFSNAITELIKSKDLRDKFGYFNLKEKTETIRPERKIYLYF